MLIKLDSEHKSSYLFPCCSMIKMLMKLELCCWKMMLPEKWLSIINMGGFGTIFVWICWRRNIWYVRLVPNFVGKIVLLKSGIAKSCLCAISRWLATWVRKCHINCRYMIFNRCLTLPKHKLFISIFDLRVSSYRLVQLEWWIKIYFLLSHIYEICSLYFICYQQKLDLYVFR